MTGDSHLCWAATFRAHSQSLYGWQSLAALAAFPDPRQARAPHIRKRHGTSAGVVGLTSVGQGERSSPDPQYRPTEVSPTNTKAMPGFCAIDDSTRIRMSEFA